MVCKKDYMKDPEGTDGHGIILGHLNLGFSRRIYVALVLIWKR